MWIFLPGGLLMPATLPSKRHDGVEVAKKWTRNGKFDLQVRGRVKSHLENFIRDYMDPMKLPHSAIQMTLKMDYDCRFYCTQEDFSKAVAQAVLDIDYQKFKPTALRKDSKGEPLYKDGNQYHHKLNAIWGVVASLGRPYGGSFWGRGADTDRAPETRRTTWTAPAFNDTPSPMPDVLEDYVPAADVIAEELYKQLKDLPHAQWSEFAPAEDLENVERWLEENNLSEAVHTEGAKAFHAIDQEPPF